MPDFYSKLIQIAKTEGFPLAGAFDFNLAREQYAEHAKRFEGWVGSGFSGTMSYLERRREERINPESYFPDLQSVLCVGLPYGHRPAGHEDSDKGVRYARYLVGRDYHTEMTERLERVMKQVAQSEPSSLRWKICVDTAPVLERSLASFAGLGWIGKNTLLIHPRWGSYLLLGEVLLNVATGRGPIVMKNFCGSCDRCLRGCPTGAFPVAGILDSRRCLSYLTLENREPALDSARTEKMGSWIAGCDLCQEVCPFNSRSRFEMMPDAVTTKNDWEELYGETEAQYRDRVRLSALKRVKYPMFRRNLEAARGAAKTETHTGAADSV